MVQMGEGMEGCHWSQVDASRRRWVLTAVMRLSAPEGSGGCGMGEGDGGWGRGWRVEGANGGGALVTSGRVHGLEGAVGADSGNKAIGTWGAEGEGVSTMVSNGIKPLTWPLTLGGRGGQGCQG